MDVWSEGLGVLRVKLQNSISIAMKANDMQSLHSAGRRRKDEVKEKAGGLSRRRAS